MTNEQEQVWKKLSEPPVNRATKTQFRSYIDAVMGVSRATADATNVEFRVLKNRHG